MSKKIQMGKTLADYAQFSTHCVGNLSIPPKEEELAALITTGNSYPNVRTVAKMTEWKEYNPNDRCNETGNDRYIHDLVTRLVTLATERQKIIESLPDWE